MARVIALTPVRLTSVAVIGAYCDDTAIGVGATLVEVVRENQDLVVRSVVLTGGGAERELAEKNAFAVLRASADIRLTVAGLPDGRLPGHRGKVQQQLAEFRRDCEPDMVFGPQRSGADQDDRMVPESIPMGRGWFDDETFPGLMRVRGVRAAPDTPKPSRWRGPYRRPKPIIRSANRGQLPRRQRDIKVRVRVAGTQIESELQCASTHMRTTTMSWDLSALSGRESSNDVYTH